MIAAQYLGADGRPVLVLGLNAQDLDTLDDGRALDTLLPGHDGGPDRHLFVVPGETDDSIVQTLKRLGLDAPTGATE